MDNYTATTYRLRLQAGDVGAALVGVGAQGGAGCVDADARALFLLMWVGVRVLCVGEDGVSRLWGSIRRRGQVHATCLVAEAAERPEEDVVQPLPLEHDGRLKPPLRLVAPEIVHHLARHRQEVGRELLDRDPEARAVYDCVYVCVGRWGGKWEEMRFNSHIYANQVAEHINQPANNAP